MRDAVGFNEIASRFTRGEFPRALAGVKNDPAKKAVDVRWEVVTSLLPIKSMEMMTPNEAVKRIVLGKRK